MEYDQDKVDEAVLALLYLNFVGDQNRETLNFQKSVGQKLPGIKQI